MLSPLQSVMRYLTERFLAAFVVMAGFLPGTVTADFEMALHGPYDYYTSSPILPRPWASQFTTWFANSAPILTTISNGVCNLTLHDYHAAMESPRGSPMALKMLSICNRHEACVYSQLAPSVQLNYQGASILLGLTPVILSTLGPTMAELALLSTHRPVLSLLISLGAPVYWVTRVFEFHNPRDAIHGGRLTIGKKSPGVAALTSTVQYVLAVTAATNFIFTMVEIGRKTTLAWVCTTAFAPLLWSTLAAFVNVVAMGSSLVIERASKLEDSHCNKTSCKDRERCRGKASCKCASMPFRKMLRRLVASETTICANREVYSDYDCKKKGEEVPKLAMFLFVVAGCMSFFLFLFGTAVFAALQFVTFIDAFKRILARLIASTIVCRLILLVELAGLRRTSNVTMK
ncbi:hypothetical protein GGR53DRAFT_506345 [Hypoxylon sp. FL1150]|nr:hypothetical protein GGR53DRAFT_506345 [Hypoxylon sp. FL1150]